MPQALVMRTQTSVGVAVLLSVAVGVDAKGRVMSGYVPRYHWKDWGSPPEATTERVARPSEESQVSAGGTRMAGAQSAALASMRWTRTGELLVLKPPAPR